MKRILALLIAGLLFPVWALAGNDLDSEGVEKTDRWNFALESER